MTREELEKRMFELAHGSYREDDIKQLISDAVDQVIGPDEPLSYRGTPPNRRVASRFNGYALRVRDQNKLRAEQRVRKQGLGL